MTTTNIHSKIKEIIFSSYPNVFDFDVKSATNGGNELNVVVTFRKSISQVIPTKVRIVLDKQTGSDKTTQIYETKSEKIQALKDDGRIDIFVAKFHSKDWDDTDIRSFIVDNKDILESEGQKLEKEDIKKVLMNAKEQMRK